MTSQQFLMWEQSTRDTIDLKKIYVDVGGDLATGVLLSQIIYWHLPSKETGKTKLRVEYDGELWLAKSRNDWWDECRISAKQFDRSISELENISVVTTVVKKFNGSPVKHIKLNIDVLVERINEIFTNPTGGKMDITQKVKTNGHKDSSDSNNMSYILPLENIVSNETETPTLRSFLPKGEYGYSPKVNMDIPQRLKSITEITPQITTEIQTTTDSIPLHMEETKDKKIVVVHSPIEIISEDNIKTVRNHVLNTFNKEVSMTLSKETACELLQQHGLDKVLAHITYAKSKTIHGSVIGYIRKTLQDVIGDLQTTNKGQNYNVIPQLINFDQRKYEDEDFEVFYQNL